MRTTKLQNLPVRTDVKGGLNPQPLPPKIFYPIAINVLRYR
jgi:hypothetical protein